MFDYDEVSKKLFEYYMANLHNSIKDYDNNMTAY